MKKKRLIKLWQQISFSTISIYLIFLFTNQSSKEINESSIIIQGNSILSKQEIIKAAGDFFPKKLIEINPKHIEFILLNKLPLKAISVKKCTIKKFNSLKQP